MPWIILVLALLGWQVGSSSDGGGAAKPAVVAAAVAAPAASPAATKDAAVEPLQWPDLRATFEAYFGRKAKSDEIKDSAILARDAKYRTDAYVALVPDPLDSFLPARFDQVLAGIQEGFAEADFLLDRVSLPWTADDLKKPDPKTFREKPGFLLFRRPGDRRLALVFLVGETAKQGVHKSALGAALGAADFFATPSADPRFTRRIRILGPTFSGSRESLRIAFDAWQATHPGREIWLVSGSATSPWLDRCTFDGGRSIRFFRTVVDDATLFRLGQSYLIERLGWAPDRIALLTEADTGYGQGAVKATPQGEAASPQDGCIGNTSVDANEKDGDGGKTLVLRFPSGLSGLRKASEDAQRGRSQSKDLTPGPSTLAISLADDSRPVDVVPEFSRLTTPTKDMALSNLLAVLCGEGKSYLGLIATDTRDRIFLAERVREICPDMQLWLLDSDLLLAHPQHRDALDGSILLSSSALFTRGLEWIDKKPPSDEKAPRGLRQFQSELHEGVVQAVAALIDDANSPAKDKPRLPAEPPNVWVSAIGNGSIWPLARLQEKPPIEKALAAGGQQPAESRLREPEKTAATADDPSDKANAVAISCLFVLIALSFWLVRVARPLRRNIPGLPKSLHRRGPFLLALATLQISWGVLLVVGGLPVWAFGRPWSQSNEMASDALICGVVLVLIGLAAFLVRNLLPSRLPGWPGLGTSLRWIAIVCTSVAAAGLLAQPLLHAWMAGGVELFHFRARKFTGGMSPIVSLAWIGGGYFLWSIIELRRRTLVAFQGCTFPIPPMAGEDPVLPGCRQIGQRLTRRMTESSPTWPFWAVIALPALGAGYYLGKFVQPVAESHAYGQAFAALAMGLFVLALISFQRFLRIWAELTGLLDRLETLGLGPRLRSLKPEVEWRPMKSFAWTIPAFKMTELSIAKLDAVPGAPSRQKLRALLAEALEGHRVGDPKVEAAGRQALQKYFDAALQGAAGWLTPGPLQDFAAVRLISYVRAVFAHLRSSLLGALVPGFLLLLAISTYEVQPKRLLFLSVWSALAAFVLLTIWTFVQMDRNPILSAIGDTNSGEVNLDRSFIQSVLTYGILPLLGLVATRFPQIERLLSGYLNPLMRFVNGGG